MKNAFLREDETRRALAAFVLDAPRLSMDAKCREFEQAFSRYQQSRDAVLFNSGGSANLALLQALKNLGRLKSGDRVGFSAVTWSTNTMPIIQLGMVPVAIDCDPSTLNVMSATFEERLSEVDVEALFITNALGFAGDLDRIAEVCREREIILLEDNCESLGTVLPGGRAGNFGVASTASFFVAHHMSTIEGGMVCTSDDDLSEMLRIVRANGWDRNLDAGQQERWRARYGISGQFEAKYTFYDLGFNLRPTEITGFLGLLQLELLDENTRVRARNFEALEDVMRSNPDLIPLKHDHISFLSSFAIPIVCRSTELRREYVARFEAGGVEIRPMIAGNMQRQPFYAKYVKSVHPTPGADHLHESGLYCGNYPELTTEDLETLARCLSPR